MLLLPTLALDAAAPAIFCLELDLDNPAMEVDEGFLDSSEI